MKSKTLLFPKDFLWGSAISAHQTEGNNRFNDWWAWEEAGRVKEHSGLACDHYSRFEEDLTLAQRLNHRAFRFSLEWSRIEPTEGERNEEALMHYRKVLESIRSRRMEPIVTLHHFTNPQWLAKKGGWVFPVVCTAFERFARKAMETYGDLVTYWITLNEPLVYVYQGYVAGVWPPGEHSFERALSVIRHQIISHGIAYRTLHEVAAARGWPRPKVGIAQNMIIFVPCTGRSPYDRFSAWLRHTFFNRLFLQALHTGRLIYPGLFFERQPIAKGTLDFVGVNYYTRDFVHFDGFHLPGFFGGVCSLPHHARSGERNDVGWEIYPAGLYQCLKEVAFLKVPILVSENGICTQKDAERWSFIRSHLAQVWKALQEGIPVFGYLYWSLLDNFEWAEGFGPRFGLVEVNYASGERSVRESAERYAEVCATGEIEPDSQLLSS